MARPEGSYTTPEYLLEKEIKAWVSTAKKTRDITDKILSGLEEDIEAKTLNLQGRLEILSGLKDIASTATRVIESGTKILSAAHGSKPGEIPVEDPEALLAEFSGGKG